MGALFSKVDPAFSREELEQLEAESLFDQAEIPRLLEVFESLGGKKDAPIPSINLFNLHQLSKNPYFNRIIDIFSDVRPDRMSFEGFVSMASALSARAPEDVKYEVMFRIWDSNNDGLVTAEDLETALDMLAEENTSIMQRKEEEKEKRRSSALALAEKRRSSALAAEAAKIEIKQQQQLKKQQKKEENARKKTEKEAERQKAKEEKAKLKAAKAAAAAAAAALEADAENNGVEAQLDEQHETKEEEEVEEEQEQENEEEEEVEVEEEEEEERDDNVEEDNKEEKEKKPETVEEVVDVTFVALEEEKTQVIMIEEEKQNAIKAGGEQALHWTAEEKQQLIKAIFAELDFDGDQSIAFPEMRRVLGRTPDFASRVTISVL